MEDVISQTATACQDLPKGGKKRTDLKSLEDVVRVLQLLKGAVPGVRFIYGFERGAYVIIRKS